MSGLGRQRESVTPETRMQQLIGKMEAIMTGTLPRSLSQAVSMDSEVSAGITAKEVIAEMVENARRAGKQSSNKRIVARLNELHISPARGSEWTTSMVDNLKRRMDTGNS